VSTSSASTFDFSPRAIADAKVTIARVLAPYDAIQTLAAIVGFSAFGAAETYSEPDKPLLRRARIGGKNERTP
jgi:hypothetical protein